MSSKSRGPALACMMDNIASSTFSKQYSENEQSLSVNNLCIINIQTVHNFQNKIIYNRKVNNNLWVYNMSIQERIQGT